MPQQEQAQAQAPAAAAASPSALAPARVPEIDMPYDCDVYEPAEDTFVLLDALQDELPCITALEPAICLEIGCVDGSVCVCVWCDNLAQGRPSFACAVAC